MSNNLTRRAFLSKSLALGSGLVVAGSSTPALADFHLPIDFRLMGKHKWTNAYNRKDIVRQAMWIVNRRFFDLQNVAQNVYDLRINNAWSFQNSQWNDLKKVYPAMKYGDHLLWYQLQTLKSWMQGRHDNPKLYIHSAYDKKNNAFGWAPYNQVRIKSKTANTYTVEGNFKIYLNFYKLGASGRNSNPYNWAATIAHEMLHNLGHQHPEPVSSPSYKLRQINTFTNSLYYGNRKYRLGFRTSNVRCGGRYPPSE